MQHPVKQRRFEMAKKDQKKFFFLACIDDNPFVLMAKEYKLPRGSWAYINALRRQRDAVKKLIYDRFKGNLHKQLKTTMNKSKDFFEKLSYDEIDFRYYLNFLLGLGNDIWEKVNDKEEKRRLGKILDHLFNLYQKIDPGLSAHITMDMAVNDLKRLERYF